ncbi:MAG: hypothetical protein AAGI66_08630 [Cyanobacteria bacterium P01_H01_bin.74]
MNLVSPFLKLTTAFAALGNSFTVPLGSFKTLKTSATQSTGSPDDRFTPSENTDIPHEILHGGAIWSYVPLNKPRKIPPKIRDSFPDLVEKFPGYTYSDLAKPKPNGSSRGRSGQPGLQPKVRKQENHFLQDTGLPSLAYYLSKQEADDTSETEIQDILDQIVELTQDQKKSTKVSFQTGLVNLIEIFKKELLENDDDENVFEFLDNQEPWETDIINIVATGSSNIETSDSDTNNKSTAILSSFFSVCRSAIEKYETGLKIRLFESDPFSHKSEGDQEPSSDWDDIHPDGITELYFQKFKAWLTRLSATALHDHNSPSDDSHSIYYLSDSDTSDSNDFGFETDKDDW